MGKWGDGGKEEGLNFTLTLHLTLYPAHPAHSHSEKDGEVRQARLNSRMQPEFTRMPSRRYPVSQPVNTCSSSVFSPCPSLPPPELREHLWLGDTQ